MQAAGELEDLPVTDATESAVEEAAEKATRDEDAAAESVDTAAAAAAAGPSLELPDNPPTTDAVSSAAAELISDRHQIDSRGALDRLAEDDTNKVLHNIC